jgi:hypothetical protein
VTPQNVALAAESLIDQAIELKSIGGVYGNQRPTHFLCLLLKLLQIQPEKEILVEYLQAEEFKYVTSIYSLASSTNLTFLRQILASTRSTICAHDVPGG